MSIHPEASNEKVAIELFRLRKEYVDELRKRHEEEAGRLEMQLSKEQRARREEQVCVHHLSSWHIITCLLHMHTCVFWHPELTVKHSQPRPYLHVNGAALISILKLAILPFASRATHAVQSVRMEVERELAKARMELKRETEHLRTVSEQDRCSSAFSRLELIKKISPVASSFHCALPHVA